LDVDVDKKGNSVRLDSKRALIFWRREKEIKATAKPDAPALEEACNARNIANVIIAKTTRAPRSKLRKFHLQKEEDYPKRLSSKVLQRNSCLFRVRIRNS